MRSCSTAHENREREREEFDPLLLCCRRCGSSIYSVPSMLRRHVQPENNDYAITQFDSIIFLAKNMKKPKKTKSSCFRMPKKTSRLIAQAIWICANKWQNFPFHCWFLGGQRLTDCISSPRMRNTINLTALITLEVDHEWFSFLHLAHEAKTNRK